MATVMCAGPACGTELTAGMFRCPNCGFPRPRRPTIAYQKGRDPDLASESGDPDTPMPGSAQSADSPSIAKSGEGDTCDHRGLGSGNITCEGCDADLLPGDQSAATTVSPFLIVGPWGNYRLTETETEIGREVGPFVDHLKGYLTVSRRHALFTITGSGRLHVVDEGSSNGTYRNGEPIKPHVSVELLDGDTVSFSTRLRVTVRQER